jgi:BlaI family transcriptional regulator, penicillinase repressor
MEDHSAPLDLSRRERQIMEAIYAGGPATAAEVLERIPDPPSYSAVRALLRILVEKGQLRHERDGIRYVYHPVQAPEKVRRSAVRHLVETFFEGSASAAMAALLAEEDELSEEELERLSELIARAREEGR